MARSSRVVVVSITDETGKPARLDDIRWEFNLDKFNSILKKHTPVGEHEHDQVDTPFSKPTTKDGRALPRIPGEAGSLARSWRLGKPWGIHTYKVKGKAAGIVIKSQIPYAEIIDQGGTVRAKYGSWMHWHQGGHDVRSRYRKGFRIQGAKYIEKATDEFLASLANVNVEWA